MIDSRGISVVLDSCEKLKKKRPARKQIALLGWTVISGWTLVLDLTLILAVRSPQKT